MKATVVAPANIAFIKYWGKSDDALRLPLNDSFSMNLSGAQTTTTVEFSPYLAEDTIDLIPSSLQTARPRKMYGLDEEEKKRIVAHLNRIRARAGLTQYARIETQNNFPAGAGIASSASGFAALTLAAATAAGLSLSEKELTVFARLGSGSAARSIPDGFVQWVAGDSSDTSFAVSVHPSSYWDIRDVIAVVSEEKKEVGSGTGMDGVLTSPHAHTRIAGIPEKMRNVLAAFAAKDFPRLGKIIEEDCLSMHHVMQTQVPPLNYWNETTQAIMDAVPAWRKEGLPVYFTIDAGPNVHLICEGKDEEAVFKKVQSIPGVQHVIRNKPAPGAHIIEDHLF